MKAVVTEGAVVVYGDKTYEGGQTFEIPEAEAEVFIAAGHILDEKVIEERKKADEQVAIEAEKEAENPTEAQE